VPSVQRVLLELDKHVNGDEGIVLGAAFYAATLSTSFRVKEFRVKDTSQFAVGVTLKSESGACKSIHCMC
jgi:molecular chaperone DnaK (HSP70)